MKKLILPSLLILLIFFNCQTYCQDSWKCPITPGSKEWAALKSEREIIAVQQIPEGILKQMPTDALLRAWFELPGRMEILAFNTMQRGFDETRARFNVLSELLSRADVGGEVLKEYAKISPSDLDKLSDSPSKGKFITDYALIELLVSQPEVLASLNKAQKNFIFHRAKQDLSIKRAFPQRDLDFFWVSSGLVLGCRILESEDLQFSKTVEAREAIRRLLRRGEIISKEEFDEADQEISEGNF